MSIYLWCLAGWLIFASLITVTQVGKDRKPLTPGVATAAMLINLLIVLGLLVDQGVL